MPESVTAVVATPSLDAVPDARFVARLAAEAWKAGNAVPAAEAQPVYLRDEVTWKKLPGR
jgi:tRNA threonylcarbamoyladenosine biosynthesis protein TsaB